MKKNNPRPKDAIFHYSLSEKDWFEEKPLYKDKVVELFRRQIINLMDVVELQSEGKTIKIDGFSFHSEPETNYALFTSSKKRQFEK